MKTFHTSGTFTTTLKDNQRSEQLGQANVYRRVVQDLLRSKIQPTLENTYPEVMVQMTTSNF